MPTNYERVETLNLYQGITIDELSCYSNGTAFYHNRTKVLEVCGLSSWTQQFLAMLQRYLGDMNYAR
jgi:hypothetical protein